MAKRLVIISYDDDLEPGRSRAFAVTVASKLKRIFINKGPYEVHTTRGSTADHIIGILADQRVPVKAQSPSEALAVGQAVAAQLTNRAAI